VALAIIQARWHATRLPGKVLLPLAGVPLLAHVWRRTVAAFGEDSVVIATTHHGDAPILGLAARLGARVFSWAGAEDDLLGRFLAAAAWHGEDESVVRVTADDPFKDPLLMRYAGVGLLFPVEVSAEHFTLADLREAESWAPASAREHLSYLHPTVPVVLPHGWRWTVDTAEDYAFAAAVYERLYAEDQLFGVVAVASVMGDPAIAHLHATAIAAAR
jgi:spore coat polysaccharide biosynthesis protein SpsF (cytidylyltransferase family)